MKNIALFVTGLLLIGLTAGAQNVGVGTNTPTEKLQVNGNIKSNNFLYSSPKTNYLTLSPADFAGGRSTDTVIRSGSGTVSMQNNVAGKRILATVHLPQGAVMTKMTAIIYDGSPENLQVMMTRKTMLENFFPENIGLTTSAGLFTRAAYETPISSYQNSNLIDNTVYSYVVDVQPANYSAVWSSFELIGVVIEYTVSSL